MGILQGLGAEFGAGEVAGDFGSEAELDDGYSQPERDFQEISRSIRSGREYNRVEREMGPPAGRGLCNGPTGVGFPGGKGLLAGQRSRGGNLKRSRTSSGERCDTRNAKKMGVSIREQSPSSGTGNKSVAGETS